MGVSITIYYQAEKDIISGVSQYTTVSEMSEHLNAIREQFKNEYPQYKNITEGYENRKH